jgi:hypothetical protein
MKHKYKFTVTVLAEDPRTAAIVRDETAQHLEDFVLYPARVSVGDINRPDLKFREKHPEAT